MIDTDALPKIELHCHLNGIFDPPMLRELQQQGHDLLLSPEDLAAAYPFDGIDGFGAYWDVTRQMRHTQREIWCPALAIHIERLKAQNVVYTEVSLSPITMGRQREPVAEMVTALNETARQHENGQIQVEFLIGLARDYPLETVPQHVENIIWLYEQGLIAGILMGGDEIGHPVRPFTHFLEQLHQTGMGIEIHAGEWVGAESVWDALEYGYLDRIGHGVTLFDDPRLIEIAQREQIHIELCPTSNLKTGSIQHIEQHPAARARDLGLNIGVNTDDPAIFECSMNSEYALLHQQFGFTTADFKALFDNSCNARFGRRPLLPVTHPT